VKTVCGVCNWVHLGSVRRIEVKGSYGMTSPGGASFLSSLPGGGAVSLDPESLGAGGEEGPAPGLPEGEEPCGGVLDPEEPRDALI
jgi:hypothetical protein